MIRRQRRRGTKAASRRSSGR